MTTPDERAAAQKIVDRWFGSLGANLKREWLYQEEEDELVSIIATELATHARRLEEARADFKRIKELVYGTGRPETEVEARAGNIARDALARLAPPTPRSQEECLGMSSGMKMLCDCHRWKPPTQEPLP
jgi:hypothetical protein